MAAEFARRGTAQGASAPQGAIDRRRQRPAIRGL
jgi:hypothetical protein